MIRDRRENVQYRIIQREKHPASHENNPPLLNPPSHISRHICLHRCIYTHLLRIFSIPLYIYILPKLHRISLLSSFPFHTLISTLPDAIVSFPQFLLATCLRARATRCCLSLFSRHQGAAATTSPSRLYRLSSLWLSDFFRAARQHHGFFPDFPRGYSPFSCALRSLLSPLALARTEKRIQRGSIYLRTDIALTFRFLRIYILLPLSPFFSILFSLNY